MRRQTGVPEGEDGSLNFSTSTGDGLVVSCPECGEEPLLDGFCPDCGYGSVSVVGTETDRG